MAYLKYHEKKNTLHNQFKYILITICIEHIKKTLLKQITQKLGKKYKVWLHYMSSNTMTWEALPSTCVYNFTRGQLPLIPALIKGQRPKLICGDIYNLCFTTSLWLVNESKDCFCMLLLINSNVGLKSTVIIHVMAHSILYDYYPFHRWIGDWTQSWKRELNETFLYLLWMLTLLTFHNDGS